MGSTGQTPWNICECGCGEPCKLPASRFLPGHCNRSSKPLYLSQDMGYQTPCWAWQWSKSSHGYGQRRIEGKLVNMHCKFYEEKYGKVPEGLELDHLCRVPSCVNPDHLEPVTHAENMRRGDSTKLTHEDVAQLRESAYAMGACAGRAVMLAKKYGITRQVVNSIIARRIWK